MDMKSYGKGTRAMGMQERHQPGYVQTPMKVGKVGPMARGATKRPADHTGRPAKCNIAAAPMSSFPKPMGK